MGGAAQREGCAEWCHLEPRCGAASAAGGAPRRVARGAGGRHWTREAVRVDREVRQDAGGHQRAAAPSRGPHRGCAGNAWHLAGRGGGAPGKGGGVTMGMTVVQKILARASGLKAVAVGDVVEPRVDLAMSHENAALVINQFLEVYAGTGLVPRVWDPERVAIIFDHRVPAESPKTATNQKKVREFVTAHQIKRFHDIRGDVGGICHQILPESGYVRPGAVVVGTDSHTTSHGALGALAFGIGATEMASVWALGAVLNVEVPPTIKIVVRGTFRDFVGPKDLILKLIGELTAEGANFRVLEFHGETVRRMSTSGRLTLCNMSVEAGATSGIVPADDETLRYLRDEAGVTNSVEAVTPDADAAYERTIEVDVSGLGPQIACPHTVDNVHPVAEVAGGGGGPGGGGPPPP